MKKKTSKRPRTFQLWATISSENKDRNRDRLTGGGNKRTMEQINECLLEANLEADAELQVVKRSSHHWKKTATGQKGAKKILIKYSIN